MKKSILSGIAISFIFTIAVTPLVSQKADGIINDPVEHPDDGRYEKAESLGHAVMFYTNIQRVVKGGFPVFYNNTLEKAALWQAEYCERKNKITTKSEVAGMQDTAARIRHYDGQAGALSENIFFFTGKNGALSEEEARKLAYEMATHFASSPETKKTTFRPGFNNIGIGVILNKPETGSLKSRVCCSQVLCFNPSGITIKKNSNGRKCIAFGQETLEVEKTVIEGKVFFYISYNGNRTVSVIQVKDSNPVIRHEVKKENSTWIYEKKKEHGLYLFVTLSDGAFEYPIVSIW